MKPKAILSGVVLGGLVLLIAFFSFFQNDSIKTFGNYQNSDTLPALTALNLEHKAQSKSASRGVITFTAGLDNDYYQAQKTNRKAHQYLETKLAAFVNEKAVRLPFNLSLVIDRSGSMAGEKIAFARQAAHKIIEGLLPQDRISIVIYDTEVEILQPSVLAIDKAALRQKIDAISDRGSTNLWGGTEKGYEQVKAFYRADHINRVLLISDGLANIGLTDESSIRRLVQQYKDRDGITLSSFGVGLDYNEILMTGMAETGAGNYYFIDTPDKMAGVFEKELNGLMKVAAQNAHLTIHLPKGVRLEKVHAFHYELKGEEVTIHFRDLFSEETKGVLLRFAINDGIQNRLTFTSTLHYMDVTDGREKKLVHDNHLAPVQDNNFYLTHFNRQVMEQMVLFTANENMELAMKQADQGKYEEARKLITSNDSYLKANKQYVITSRELQVMDSANRSYSGELNDAETKSEQELKYMQKSKRSDSYKVRTKKQ